MFKAAAVVSGDGYELQSLLDGLIFGEIPGFALAAVVATEPGSNALARAARAGVPTYTVDAGIFPNSATFTRALTAKLMDLDVEGALLCAVEPEPGESFYRAFAGRCVCLRLTRAAGSLTAVAALADADGSEARRLGRASIDAPENMDTATLRRALVEHGAGDMLSGAVKSYMKDFHS